MDHDLQQVSIDLHPDRLDRFAFAVRHREAGDEPGPEDDVEVYATTNQWGYLGAYQFGMARLCDLGLTQRKPGCRGHSNDQFEWRHPYSEAGFLADRDLQDRTFRAHIQRHARWLEKQGLLSYCGILLSKLLRKGLAPGDQDAPLTVWGLLGVCHLTGPGKALDLCHEGRDSRDALGTRASDYVREFAHLAD